MASHIEKNKALVRRIFTLLSEGKIEEGLEPFGPDGEWWVAGQNGPGMTMTVPEIAASFRGVLTGPAKGVQFTERGMVAEGDRVLIEVVGEGKISTGHPYCNRYCFIFQIKDGVIVGGHEYMDTAHAASAFAGLGALREE